MGYPNNPEYWPVESRARLQKVRIWDDLLIFGLVLAPMTGLRIWKIGPAEVLVLLWCLKFFPRQKLLCSSIVRFFALYLGSMAMGTLWGYLVAREELIPSYWYTWLYIAFVSIGMYEGLRQNTPEYNENLLYKFVLLAALWNIGLYGLALSGVRSILGAPLWYYHRYSGGGTNPHQVAIMMCGLVFILLHEVIYRRRVLLNLILAVFCAVILLRTKSSTCIMALAAGLVTEVMVIVNRRAFGRGERFNVIVLEILFGMLILLVTYRVLYRYAYDWIASDPNGLSRFRIFSNIKNTFLKGPIFGIGPGIHSHTESGLMIEYHNTYLEVLSASGLVGMAALIIFTIRLLKQITADNTFLPVIVALYVYGMAGFGMRRLVHWGIVVFVLVIGEQKKREKELRTNE